MNNQLNSNRMVQVGLARAIIVMLCLGNVASSAESVIQSASVPPPGAFDAADWQAKHPKLVPEKDPTKAYYKAWMGDRMLVPLTAGTVYTLANAPTTPALEALERRDSLTQYDITWHFSEKVPVGKFINGDWYVVGPVTVTSIDPKPLYGSEVKELIYNAPLIWENKRPETAARNGSTLNIPGLAPRTKKGGDKGCGFDSRIPEGRYDETQFTPLPIAMRPGDALCSSISNENKNLMAFGAHADCVKLAAVLTCVKEPLPADAFRPSYCDTQHSKIYLARDLKREVFLRLPKPSTLGADGLASVKRMTRAYQMPHIDVSDYEFGHPAENYPEGMYGEGQGYTNGTTLLLLNMDFTPEEKEPLIINLVQVGIDYMGLARGGRVWRMHGGLHTGRKLPVVMAGLLLDDADMKDPYKAVPTARFQEDEQTAMCPMTYRGQTFEKNWMGAKAIFVGHSLAKDGPHTGVWEKLSGCVDLYHPKDWPVRADQPKIPRLSTSERYRRANTSASWVSTALALRMMHQESLWNHDAFFAYVDRWMTEDDTPLVEAMKEYGSDDHTKIPLGRFKRQGFTGSSFGELTKHMWTTYRNNLPPAANGRKTPNDTETWK